MDEDTMALGKAGYSVWVGSMMFVAVGFLLALCCLPHPLAVAYLVLQASWPAQQQADSPQGPAGLLHCARAQPFANCSSPAGHAAVLAPGTHPGVGQALLRQRYRLPVQVPLVQVPAAASYTTLVQAACTW